jgi:peptidoglycan/LPS O-acetylase OafA/YrhL
VFDVLAAGSVVTLMWGPAFLSINWQYSLRAALFAYFIVRIFFSAGVMRLILRQPFLVFIGVISYSFYLYHQCVNGLLHGLLLGQTPKIENWSDAAVAGATMLLAGALATLSTKYFEMPIRRLARGLTYLPARKVLAGELGRDGP